MNIESIIELIKSIGFDKIDDLWQIIYCDVLYDLFISETHISLTKNLEQLDQPYLYIIYEYNIDYTNSLPIFKQFESKHYTEYYNIIREEFKHKIRHNTIENIL